MSILTRIRGFFRHGRSRNPSYVKPHYRNQDSEHWKKIKSGWDEVRNLRRSGHVDEANTLAQQLKNDYAR